MLSIIFGFKGLDVSRFLAQLSLFFLIIFGHHFFSAIYLKQLFEPRGAKISNWVCIFIQLIKLRINCHYLRHYMSGRCTISRSLFNAVGTLPSFLPTSSNLLTPHIVVGTLHQSHPEALRRRSQSTRSFQD